MRWLPSGIVFSPNDLTPIAIVEWVDVLLIICWTNGATWFFRPSFKCCLCSSIPSSAVAHATARQVLTGLVSLFIGTLVACLAFYVKQGRSKPGTWPYISDTWVYPPGDWISRWAVPLGGSFTIIELVPMLSSNGSHPAHPYHRIPSRTISHHTIPYHTISYHLIPYHTSSHLTGATLYHGHTHPQLSQRKVNGEVSHSDRSRRGGRPHDRRLCE